jgi:hypothetical protein
MSLSGKPPIAQPRGVANDLTLAIGNIRQRLEAIETAVNTAAATTPTNTSITAQVKLLQTQLNTLAADVAALSSTSTTGTTVVAVSNSVSLAAAETLTGFQAVYQSQPGGVSFVDPSVPARARRPLGVTTTAAGAGVNVPVQISGALSVGASIFTPGGLVYAGAGGALTQTAPAAGTAIVVGLAVTATTLVVAPQDPVLITAGAFNPATDGLMAASRAAVAAAAAVIWQVRGVQIGQQSTVDFEAGSGLYWTAYNDAGSNRVVLTINLGTPPAPATIITQEDPWPHDDWPEDSWPEWQDDAVPRGANNPVPPPFDPSVLFEDDHPDQWELWQEDSRANPGFVGAPPTDPTPWFEDDHGDQWEADLPAQVSKDQPNPPPADQPFPDDEVGDPWEDSWQ